MGQAERFCAATNIPDLASKIFDIDDRVVCDVEVLTFPAGIKPGGDDSIRYVRDVGEATHLLAGAQYFERIVALGGTANQIRYDVCNTRFVLGVLARPVGVKRPDDG